MKHLENPRLWRWVLAGMFVPLAFVAFWPDPVDQPIQREIARVLRFLHAHGVPARFNYRFVEASANVGLFVPFGVVGSLAFAEKRWWQIGAFGLIISGIMELGQLLFLHNRYASPLDLVTNTGGAVIGAVLALSALKKLQARRLSAVGL